MAVGESNPWATSPPSLKAACSKKTFHGTLAPSDADNPATGGTLRGVWEMLSETRLNARLGAGSLEQTPMG